MEECCAPQWVDFTETCSPQVPMQDYFEKEHMIHGHIIELCEPTSENSQSESKPIDLSCINTEAEHDLNIIKSTPVKVISPKSHSKETLVKEITYDQVLSDAMRKLELCKKPSKAQDVLNKTQDSFKNVFKTPSMPAIKPSKSTDFHSVPNKRFGLEIAPNSARTNKNVAIPQGSNNTSVHIRNTKSVSCALFRKDEECVHKNILKGPNGLENKNDEEDNKKMQYDKLDNTISDYTNKKEDDQEVLDSVTEKCNKSQCKRGGRASVLTSYNRRRSYGKRRTCNNFISLAEAVSRFQNDTPKRFRTRSNKDTTLTQSLKLTQNRLKPTIPISPALMSKKRTRVVTVLSQEEREQQELKEMKKYQIKANPIPPNILKGPHIVKTMAKPKTITESAVSSTISAQSKSPAHYDKASSSKNTVTKVVVTDPTGIIVEREDITFFGVPKDTTVKSVTRIMPFSFEARNKDLQMKKEQRIKGLEQASKTKTEFHAKPVPNFSKKLTMPKQQHTKKSIVQSCPFSFEERDKNISKKKDELVKQVLDEDKKSRVFRANPAPVFKPVIVRGVSKERLLMKEKIAKMVDENTDNQENKEPNVIASKAKIESSKYVRKAKSTSNIQNASLKVKQEGDTESKVLPVELNTDKRAKQRREFDEKIKRKEIEEEIKRQEKDKERLKHEKLMNAELRKLAEVKARPMPTYKPRAVIKAMKPLTDPQSPAFASKLRSKQT